MLGKISFQQDSSLILICDSARQIDAFDFNFGLPTADPAPLQPIKSGRGRPRKTPQRESLPLPSSRRTPKIHTSTKRGRPSKSSSSNTSKRPPSSKSSETTKVDSERKETETSSQPTKSDESGRISKTRRVNGIASDVTSGEDVAQRDGVLPDIQESLQEDAVPESTINILHAIQDAETDAESPLASKDRVTRKRKKRKSITMRPRKRISVGPNITLQSVVEKVDTALNEKDTAVIVTKPLAEEDQVLQEVAQDVEAIRDDNESRPEAEESALREDKALQELNENAPNRGSLPRRRKKRKSIVMATKTKKRPISPPQRKQALDDRVEKSSPRQHVGQKSKGQKMSREPRSRQESDFSASSVQISDEAIISTTVRRRGRPPGSSKTKDLSPQTTQEQEEQNSIASKEVRKDQDDRPLIAKRRGRPPRSENTILGTKKVKKASQAKKAQEKPVVKQLLGLKSKGGLNVAKAKEKTRQNKTTKVSEKRVRKEPKYTKRSAETVPITVQRTSRQVPIDSEDDMALDIAPYPKKRGVNAIDVLGQVCTEIIDNNLDGLEDEAERTTHKPTRKALKRKCKIVQVFKDDLEGTLAQMTEAFDRNEALKKRLRQVTKEKATAKADLLSLQKEVEEVAVELDIARMEHDEVSGENRACLPGS